MDGIKIAVLIGLIFSPLAAFLAFLLTYNEYSHHYSDNKMPMKHSIEAGVFTFIVFMIISVLIGWVLNRGL
jgi:ABC-type antimicrobial peptide transport system permease subunit